MAWSLCICGAPATNTNFGAAMLEDVGDAFRRFVEIDRNGDAARTCDGEVGGVPFRPVGRKKADAVARLYAEFDKCRGKPRDTAQEFFGGDRLPAIVSRGTFVRGDSAVSR